MKAIAFAPGHITGFFAPKFDKDFLKTGSRGAGINISLGAKSEVIVNNSKKTNFNIFINGKKSNFPIIQTALKYLIREKKINIDIKMTLDLPLGQGFGMSAASIVSSSYAISKIMNISYYDALKASHYSEIYHKTGLGDVISCTFGGIEIRNKPGIPPWGSIEHIIGNYELVICIIDDVIETKKILNDRNKIKMITKYGNYCTDEIKKSPTIENLFFLSNFFTEKTNLGTKKVIETIRIANKYGKASMCMLGNSIFAIGKTNILCEKLKKYGKIYICKVDELGARILN